MAHTVPPPPRRPQGPPPPSLLALRGAALGAWVGTALATGSALYWGHSPFAFLQALVLGAGPLALLGGALGLLAAHSHPEPHDALGISEAKPIPSDDLQRLLSRR